MVPIAASRSVGSASSGSSGLIAGASTAASATNPRITAATTAALS